MLSSERLDRDGGGWRTAGHVAEANSSLHFNPIPNCLMGQRAEVLGCLDAKWSICDGEKNGQAQQSQKAFPVCSPSRTLHTGQRGTGVENGPGAGLPPAHASAAAPGHTQA